MRYFTSTINGRTVLGWNPLLQPLSQDQKKTFASKLAQVKQDYRDESYACNPTTRTEMVNFINQSITFLKANEVKKIPEYQLYSRDDYQHYLQKKDLLDDVFWASTIGVTDFFTHYLSGDDISEPIGLLDTLAFFPMLKMMNLIVDYYLLTHNIRNAQAESVHEAISLTPESLGRIAKSSHTLFAALGMIDLSASPDQTPRP